MEEKNKRSYYTTSSYDGSAVRKLNTIPNTRREQDEIRRQEPRKAPKARPRRKPAIGLFTFLVLTAAIGITLYSAVDYLNVQMEITNLGKTVAARELELTKLIANNDATLSEIDTSLDLKQVFDVAVNELGMVFPNNNQVITYESAVSEYVRQYDRVPEADAKELLRQLFQ